MKNTFKYGLNTVTAIILTLGIVVVVMLISYHNNKRFDMTQEKIFTLSDQTVKVLQGLQSDIEVDIFHSRGSNFSESAKNLLDQYRYHSKKITIASLETNQNPALAREYKLTQPDAIVIRGNDRREVVTRVEEQAITNAILNLTRSEKKHVYFVTGHGERSTQGQENPDISGAREELEKEAYQVSTISLISVDKIPDDCNLLIIAGPQTPYMDHEIEVIREYLNRYGAVMFLFEPWRNTPRLFSLLQEKGLVVDDNIVIDRVSKAMGGEFYIPVATSYEEHPITMDFHLITFFPFSRSLDFVSPRPKNKFWAPLVKTSAPAPGSWGEARRPQRNAQISYEEGVDKPGPLIIGVAGSDTDPVKSGLDVNGNRPPDEDPEDAEDAGVRESRMVVFGCVDFISNQFLPQQGNSNIFLNSVSWLTQQENLISIRPRHTKTLPLYLKEQDKNNIFFLSMIMMPALVILTGVAVKWLRR